jgi:hypothetical protein
MVMRNGAMSNVSSTERCMNKITFAEKFRKIHINGRDNKSLNIRGKRRYKFMNMEKYAYKKENINNGLS